MKLIILLVAVLSLVSCNTTIGVWRDSKAGFLWTKDRIQGAGASGQDFDYEYGAPIY